MQLEDGILLAFHGPWSDANFEEIKKTLEDLPVTVTAHNNIPNVVLLVRHFGGIDYRLSSSGGVSYFLTGELSTDRYDPHFESGDSKSFSIYDKKRHAFIKFE